MTTAARRPPAVTDADRAAFDRLLTSLRFDPARPPEKLPTESVTQYLARVFDLTGVHRAYAEGHKVDEAGRALSDLARDSLEELHQQRRAIHLAAARTVADGKAPKVDAKACAELAAAGDRVEYLKHATMNAMRPSQARARADEAMNAEPVAVAAQVLTLARILAAHEVVRGASGVRRTPIGRPNWETVYRVIGDKHGWVHGKSADDRRYIAAVDSLAREWADTTVANALRERMEARRRVEQASFPPESSGLLRNRGAPSIQPERRHARG